MFSEEIVRIWCRSPTAPYEDIGRPTIAGSRYTLDYALHSRTTGLTYVAELKCEITFENYEAMTLRSRTQLDRHARDKEAFRRFLALARDPSSHLVTIRGNRITPSGSILVWGDMTAEGRRDVMEGYGFFDVISVSDVISKLRETKNAEFQEYIQKRRQWCCELFDFLSPE